MSFTNLPLPIAIASALEALPHKKFEDYGMPNDLAPAGIVLQEDGHHALVIGDQYENLNEEQRAFLLLHEYTHLAFGHPYQAQEYDLNPIGWNIATDAWINEVHPHRLTKSMNGILYSDLRNGLPETPPTAQCPQGIPARDPIPELPKWLVDPLTIYKILKDKAQQQWNQMDGMIIQKVGKDGKAQAGLEILKARKTLRDAAAQDPTIQKIIEELGSQYTGSRGTYKEVRVAEWLEQLYSHISYLAKEKQGDLIRRRGWRRPGRFPGLPGVARRPSLHVMIALDVSGSTTQWWGDLVAACRGITRDHHVEIVCHSDDIVFHGDTVPMEAPVGGGTNFAPVCQLANRVNPDCLIWVTDGESSDHPALPPCPIAWVWLPGSRKWNLRERDMQVDYASQNQ